MALGCSLYQPCIEARQARRDRQTIILEQFGLAQVDAERASSADSNGVVHANHADTRMVDRGKARRADNRTASNRSEGRNPNHSRYSRGMARTGQRTAQGNNQSFYRSQRRLLFLRSAVQLHS